MTGNVQAVELVFLLLLLFVVAFGALARKLQVPYPIVLVIAGGLLGFVPGIPKIALNPDVIFFVILPPLLYSAAWVTSWREFSFNLFSILLLAFGLLKLVLSWPYVPIWYHFIFTAVLVPMTILGGTLKTAAW